MKYTSEFKNYVVRFIVDGRHPTGKTASDFDIPLKTLEKWITAYNKNPNCFNTSEVAEKQIIATLTEKYNQVLKDNEMLKEMVRSLTKQNEFVKNKITT